MSEEKLLIMRENHGLVVEYATTRSVLRQDGTKEGTLLHSMLEAAFSFLPG